MSRRNETQIDYQHLDNLFKWYLQKVNSFDGSWVTLQIVKEFHKLYIILIWIIVYELLYYSVTIPLNKLFTLAYLWFLCELIWIFDLFVIIWINRNTIFFFYVSFGSFWLLPIQIWKFFKQGLGFTFLNLKHAFNNPFHGHDHNA